MKTLLCALTSLLAFGVSAPGMAGDGCYLCTSESDHGIQQCRYRGSDTWEQRKACIDSGCKIGGTASCSTAANVKVINPN
jgi:hypothetical protein